MVDVQGRTPLDDAAEYARDTPFYHAIQVRTPLLVIDGTNDFEPPQTSRNFYDAVAATGTPARYMLFQDEMYFFQNPNSQFIAAQAQIEWFRQYLTGTHASGLPPVGH